jgi:hypothetical protein
MASEKALENFKGISTGKDIWNLDWADQPHFDDGHQKGIFHLEHIYSGDMFRNAVEGILECKNRTARLAEIVQTNYRVAWILKSEDGILRRKGRGKTLVSALDYYKKCGIILVDRSNQ